MNKDFNPSNRPGTIKKEETRTCPACGQEIHPAPKYMTNVMSEYEHPITKNKVVMNSDKDTVEIAGETFHRVKYGNVVGQTAPVEVSQVAPSPVNQHISPVITPYVAPPVKSPNEPTTTKAPVTVTSHATPPAPESPKAPTTPTPAGPITPIKLP